MTGEVELPQSLPDTPGQRRLSHRMSAALTLGGMSIPAFGAAGGLLKFGGAVLLVGIPIAPVLASGVGAIGLVAFGYSVLAAIGGVKDAKKDDAAERNFEYEKRAIHLKYSRLLLTDQSRAKTESQPD